MVAGRRTTGGVFDYHETGGMAIPAGNSAQRSVGTPRPGYLRYNTTSDFLEVFDGAAWKPVNASAGTVFVSGPYILRTGDAMSGRLGIIRGNGFFPGLYFVGESNTGLFQQVSGSIGFSTEGAIAMTITQNYVETLGNLGVRTYPASAPLTVEAYVSSRFVAEFFSVSVSGAKILMRDGSSRWVYGVKDGEWFVEDRDGRRNLIVKASGYTVARSDAPSGKLHVESLASAGASESRRRAQILFRETGTTYWEMGKRGNRNFFLRNRFLSEDVVDIEVSGNRTVFLSAVPEVEVRRNFFVGGFPRYRVRTSSYGTAGRYSVDAPYIIVNSAAPGVEFLLPPTADRGTVVNISNFTTTNITAVTESVVVIPGGVSARTIPTFRTGRFIFVSSAWYDISI